MERVKVELKLITYPGLYYAWDSCLLPSGQIFVSGCKTEKLYESGNYKFYLCNTYGKTMGQTINAPCSHIPECFLPVTINKKEYLCTSCPHCEKLRLINLDNLDVSPLARLATRRRKVTMAYNGLYMWRMCQGESNTLYTVDWMGVISVLDTSGTNFILKQTLPKIDIHVTNMCYMTEHHLIALSSWQDKRLCAIRSSDGQIVWDKLIEQIDSNGCNPRGLVYLPHVDLLLVGDRDNRRTIVVEAASGNVIQTIELKEADYIRGLHINGTKLTVRHGDYGSTKVSFYAVN